MPGVCVYLASSEADAEAFRLSAAPSVAEHAKRALQRQTMDTDKKREEDERTRDEEGKGKAPKKRKGDGGGGGLGREQHRGDRTLDA